MLPLLLALSPVGLAQPPQPVFAVTAAGTASSRGRIESLGDGWAVTLQADGTGPVAVPKAELVGLRRTDRSLPAWPRGPVVVLANGDRIAGTVTAGNDKMIRFAPRFPDRGATDWSFPLTSLAAVWVTPPPPDTPVEPAAYPWAAGPNRRDAVLLRNGDVVRGTVEEFTEAPAVRVKVGAATTTVPLTQLAAIAFDPALARVRKPRGPFARAVLADGSRVSLATAKGDGVVWAGTTLTATLVELPVSQVVALDVFQGKAVYLSDLKPKSAVSKGYGGLAWPWAADRSVKSHPLRVGADTFDKGLGTHPRTTLTYDLGGKYRRFEAVVGLDPATGRRGAADVRVRVDGKEVPLDGLKGLTAASPAVVSVDVTGAKELTLAIDFGPAGDVQADVNWGTARLIE